VYPCLSESASVSRDSETGDSLANEIWAGSPLDGDRATRGHHAAESRGLRSAPYEEAISQNLLIPLAAATTAPATVNTFDVGLVSIKRTATPAAAAIMI
jgi:hypothetical protein